MAVEARNNKREHGCGSKRWKQEITRGNMAVEARDDKREHGCGSKRWKQEMTRGNPSCGSKR